MKDLQNYTDEQLREELKRRARECRANTPREIIYKEFEATVAKLDNIKCERLDGSIAYKPFQFWRYRLTDCTSNLPNQSPDRDYYLKYNTFKRDNAPKVGDRVRVRYRRTKKDYEVFDLHRAKIVEIVKA